MIQFDSIDIQSSSYVIKTFKHDSAPEREISILQLARQDGGVLVSEKFLSKSIVVQGILKANTQAAMETLCDSFKELLSRRDKNLDITYAGGTRRYVAYARRVDIDRDFFHLLFAPFEVEFIVPGGMGIDTSETAAVNATDADPTYTDSVVLAGTAIPKPKITMTIGTGWSAALGIRFYNSDTGEECIINRSAGFTNADVLIVNCDTKKVTLNAIEIPFYRVFPSFIIGTNNFGIYAGDIIDQSFVPPASYTTVPLSVNAGSQIVCQSFFVSHTDATYQGIAARIKKNTPDFALTIEIQTDTAGQPSGTAVTNATFSIAAADVGATYDWEFANSASPFTLTANTRYWIVFKKTAGAASGSYDIEVCSGQEANYGRGNVMTGSGAGPTYTEYVTRDVFFKLYFGGKAEAVKPNLTLDIDYTKKYL